MNNANPGKRFLISGYSHLPNSPDIQLVRFDWKGDVSRKHWSISCSLSSPQIGYVGSKNDRAAIVNVCRSKGGHRWRDHFHTRLFGYEKKWIDLPNNSKLVTISRKLFVAYTGDVTDPIRFSSETISFMPVLGSFLSPFSPYCALSHFATMSVFFWDWAGHMIFQTILL